jgi:phosphoglucosamine mutase
VRKYFGTDGIRGKANEILTPQFVLKLGQAAGIYFKTKKEKPRLLIGMDTRLSGDMLANALCAGLTSVGVNVTTIGVIPTPGVAYCVRTYGFDAGVVLSASHNPFEDNGIKFFSDAGYKLPDEVEEQIEELLLTEQPLVLAGPSNMGTVTYDPNMQNAYATFLTNVTPNSCTRHKIVIDGANGAASRFAKNVFEAVGYEVVSIFCAPDGVNINENCGSTHLEALQKEVVKQGAIVGFAFDGDADRLMAVDEKGQTVDGDDLLYAFATTMKQKGALSQNTVALTIMSNYGLIKALESAGIDVTLTAVGDRYVIEEMQKKSLNLGGESSGHLILSDYNTTGDGMLAAVIFLELLSESGKTVSQITKTYAKSAQHMSNVHVANKEGWQQNDAIVSAIAEATKKLEQRGRVLVRASGTEQLIRVMAEGPDESEVRSIVDHVANIVREQCS